MSDAPAGFVTLTYAQAALGWPYTSVWNEARRGSFGPLERRGRTIYVEQARVDAFVRRQAADYAVHSGYTADVVDRIGPLYEATKRAHQLGITIAAATMEREMIITTIRGDAAEQRQAGDVKAAEDFEDTAQQLEDGLYAWDAETGRWSFRIETEAGVLVNAPPRQPA